MITTVIIAITVVLSYRAFNNPRMMDRWVFNAYKIKNFNQYYRLLTSGFIHKDWTHLIFNMFTLYFLGSGVENYFMIKFANGGILYVALYILAIIASSIPSFVKHKDHEFYNSLGASGGVSALVFCFILVKPLVPLCLFGLLCLPGFILGTLYMVYTYQMSKKSMDHINHDAHLYGALFGLIFILILNPSVLMEFVNQVSQYKLF